MHMTPQKIRAVEEMAEKLGVEIERCSWSWEGEEVIGGLKPGDTYIAIRNTGPHLLTCQKIVTKMRGKTVLPWVVPEEKTAYSFDINECWRVVSEA